MLAIPGETFPLASPEPQWAPNRGVDINSNPSPSLLLRGTGRLLLLFFKVFREWNSKANLWTNSLWCLPGRPAAHGGEQPPSELDVSPRAPAGPVYPRPVNRLSIYLETAVKWPATIFTLLEISPYFFLSFLLIQMNSFHFLSNCITGFLYWSNVCVELLWISI